MTKDMKWFIVFLVLVVAASFFTGFMTGYVRWRNNNTAIAPAYALDNECTDDGRYCIISLETPPFFNIQPNGLDFWHEATKNTRFTMNSKPVEITDIQIFYRSTSDTELRWNKCNSLSDWERVFASHDSGFYGTITSSDGAIWAGFWVQCHGYGNITYYPLGIENSQTYKELSQICWKAAKTTSIGNLTLIFEHEAQCPTPTPKPSCVISIETFDKFLSMELLYSTPTPTPTLVFPDTCSDGCLIYNKGLGNCT